MAQTQKSTLSHVAGVYDASNFAYGLAPGSSAAVITTGNTTTGAGTSVETSPNVVLGDGRAFNPFAVGAPIRVIDGSNSETVTPTGVSVGTDGMVTITADFANTHARGALITSGTGGLQEAINAANADGGGVVVIDQAWLSVGGTQTVLLAATLASGVAVHDNRGPSGYAQVASGDADAIVLTAGRVIVTTAGVDAMTLATPTAGTDDGLEIEVVSAGAHAHTITTAANKINGTDDTATFGAAAGNSIRLVAYQGVWYAVNLTGVTLSEV